MGFIACGDCGYKSGEKLPKNFENKMHITVSAGMQTEQTTLKTVYLLCVLVSAQNVNEQQRALGDLQTTAMRYQTDEIQY